MIQQGKRSITVPIVTLEAGTYKALIGSDSAVILDETGKPIYDVSMAVER